MNGDAGLEPPYGDHGSTEELLSHQRRVQRLLFDHGFMRWGWPVEVGGLGGNPLFRAVLGEELTGRGLVHSAAYSMTEVLGPAVIEYAEATLAAEVVPALLRGDETWCQGFSEPEAGSDLGSLRTTAVRDGDGWVLQGQKLWTSWAHHATRCIVLARTEGPGTGSRGISAFFVDMDSPGIDVHPLDTMAGVDEFCETFFEEVPRPGRIDCSAPLDKGGRSRSTSWVVNGDRSSGNEPAGSSTTSGRSSTWPMPTTSTAQRLIGHAFAEVSALRARSRSTQRQVAAGELRAAESSVDKILDRDGRSGRVRRRPTRPCRRGRAGRLILGRPVPQGMGVLPCGDDLRWHERDPEGHRGVAPAEPAQGALDGCRRVAHCSTRRCFGLAAAERGGLSPPRWTSSGGATCFTTHPEEAVSAFFDAQGRTGNVVGGAARRAGDRGGQALGLAGPVNVVLPRPRAARGRAALHDGEVTVDGVLLGPRDEAATLVAAVRSPPWGQALAVAVEPEDLQVERRQGLDPGLWRVRRVRDHGPEDSACRGRARREDGGRWRKLEGGWPCAARWWPR